jgi:hypothetical protein
MSCFEGCRLSGETLDRADDGFWLIANFIGPDLSPLKADPLPKAKEWQLLEM